MEYTVVKDYIDRDTKETIKAGSILTCLEPSRAEILIKRGYIAEKEEAPEEVKEPKKETAKEKTAAKASGTKKAPAKKAATKSTVKKSKKE